MRQWVSTPGDNSLIMYYKSYFTKFSDATSVNIGLVDKRIQVASSIQPTK